ncbi:hypothetical protein [Agromyces sp. ISL-38]|uniref:aggregation-promoting factor C-terminal-like domain-containing protein n=1 Tax=Agromyces sp. ISL-38 TaxID=2819107 RepID=UPI001BE52AD0|nr:hypothetical protein [Agromyces sp. ISL-38]MBT2518971.1 hypothetical protein [Streptomyces sp. ISL-90]
MRIDTPTPTTAEATEKNIAERSTRRGLRRRRAGRKRLMIAGAIAAVGLVAGTGFTVQSAVATQARIDATTALTQSTGLDHDQLGAYRTIAAARALDTAADTISVANATLAAVDGKVDASGLAASVASLGDYRALPIDSVVDLTEQTRAEVAKAAAAAAEYDRVQAEEAAAAAQALALGNTPDGARATARSLAAATYGWGDSQFQCLDQLWQKESGWSYTAYNASSGATGIPQSLPGSKMATAGSDWETNATTQVTWGLDYIARAYGTPCSAWSHSQSMNWY